MRISDWSSDVCSSDLRKSSRIWWRSHNTAIGIGFTSRARKNFGDRSGLRPVKRGSRYGATSQTIAISRSLIGRSEEHTSELQSLMRTSYAVFCLKKKTNKDEVTTQKTN